MPFTEFGVNFIKSESITSDGRINPSTFAFIGIETHKKLARSQIQADDILFSMAGIYLGKTAIVSVEYTPANTNQAVGIIRIDSNLAYPRFIHYALSNPVVKAYVQQSSAQSAQPNYNLAEIGDLSFQLPPLTIQKAIAHILGTMDDRIELCRRMNETLGHMARALFKDWFIDFGPVRAKMEGREPLGLPPEIAALFPSKLVDSELGEIPEGWGVCSLLEISDLNCESWSKKRAPQHIEYLDLSNVKWGVIEAITHYPWSEAPSRAQRIARPGDTIVGTVRPGNGSFCLVDCDGLTVSTGFAVLRPKYKASREFLYLAATSPENIERLTHLADGGAYPAVRPEVVAATCITCPQQPRAILEAFSGVTSKHLDQMQFNQSRVRSLSTLRDTLLPKLLSGELSIPEAMLQVEAA